VIPYQNQAIQWAGVLISGFTTHRFIVEYQGNQQLMLKPLSFVNKTGNYFKDRPDQICEQIVVDLQKTVIRMKPIPWQRWKHNP